jgi:hypothetical protein
VGTIPVIALLPPLGSATLPPRLRSFGEPCVGRSLEVQVVQAPAGTTLAGLLVGFEQPGSGSPCAQFIDNLQNPSSTIVAIDGFGFGRTTVSFPANPAFIHMSLMMQAAMFPVTQQLTNGLRVTLGGGL